MNQKSFKEKLISIKQEFFNYLKVNACQGIPAKELSTILQKYFHVRPSSLQKMLTKNVVVDIITW